MPRVNIYIRNEDLENWNMIDDKPEWLHFHLHRGVKVITNNPDGSGKIEDLTEEKIIIPSQDKYKLSTMTSDAIQNPQPGKGGNAYKDLEAAHNMMQKELSKSPKLCKHGNPKGQCLDKKADRSCRL